MHVMLLSAGNILQDLWTGLSLADAIRDVASGVQTQMALVIPAGIMLTGVLAVPRIVKRIIHTFL